MHHRRLDSAERVMYYIVMISQYVDFATVVYLVKSAKTDYWIEGQWNAGVSQLSLSIHSFCREVLQSQPQLILVLIRPKSSRSNLR